MKLDPLSLRLFVAVLEEGAIAAAALREHIAAPAVSKRMSELEAVFDTQLIVRSNKGVHPTAAGIALLNLARGVLHDLDEIHAHMREYSSGTRGHVRVFANISAINQFLPGALKSYLALHPLVQIRLEEQTSDIITRAVAENSADIGIVTAGAYRPDLEVVPFRKDRLVVVVPKVHPLAHRRSVTFAETLDYDYVGLHAGSTVKLQLVKAASELGRTLNLRIEVTSFDALCLMVEAGLGIGVLPSDSSKPYLKALSVKTIRLDEPWAERQLVLCMRSYAALSVAARLLADHLREPPQLCESASACESHRNAVRHLPPEAPAIAERDGGIAND